MSLLTQKFKFLRKAEKSQSGHQQIEQGGRTGLGSSGKTNWSRQLAIYCKTS